MSDVDRTKLQEKLDLALVLEEDGNFPVALRLINDVLAIDAAFPEARFRRGNVHFHARDFAAAIDDYRAAEALDPASARPPYNLGVACLHMGDSVGSVRMELGDGTRVVSGPADAHYRDAIDAFTRALALEPDHNRALVMRAFAHRNRLDDAAARADFEAAAALGDPVAKRELSSM